MHTGNYRDPLLALRGRSHSPSAEPAAAASAPLQGAPPKLLDQVRRLLRTRHSSYRTEEAYVGWIRRFIIFHRKRHPAELGRPEIQDFLSALAVERQVVASIQNQALAALLFLYREVLQRDPGWLDDVVRAKRPGRLPVVLTPREVEALFGALSGVPWIMAMLLYGSGLRLMECMRLRVKNIDAARGEVVVREGKGNRDRVTMLPAVLGRILADHLRRVEHLHRADLQAGLGLVMLPAALAVKYANAAAEFGWQWVFPASNMSAAVAEGIKKRFAVAVEKKKHVADSVEAGREYVEAYVDYIHFVESVNRLASHGASHLHHESDAHAE